MKTCCVMWTALIVLIKSLQIRILLGKPSDLYVIREGVYFSFSMKLSKIGIGGQSICQFLSGIPLMHVVFKQA